MRKLLLIGLSSLVFLGAQVEHGPYAGREGWICSRIETMERAKNVQCECKMPCHNGGNEDKSCKTYCGKPQCHCHDDESCDAPEVTPKGRKK